MHDLQKILLKRLFDQNGQRYSSLAKGYTYEENIVFHLKQLTAKRLIEKTNNDYLITAQGIKEITKYDLPKLLDTGLKTFFIGFLCSHENEYLIKEHPQNSRNFYNLPSGKPHFGEKIESALTRIFEENTSLKLDSKAFSFFSLHLKTIKTSAGKALFDDAFAIYRVELDSTQYSQMRPKKTTRWMNIDEISGLKNCWPEIAICILEKNTAPYMAYEFVSDYILES